MADQLAILFGRTVTLPADDDGSYTLEDTDRIAVVADMSPAQSLWMGREPPRVASHPTDRFEARRLLWSCREWADAERWEGQTKPTFRLVRVTRKAGR